MNTAIPDSGQAQVLKFLGMPPQVRTKFDELISGQATALAIGDLADALVLETPITQLQLILVPLLSAYHQVHQINTSKDL